MNKLFFLTFSLFIVSPALAMREIDKSLISEIRDRFDLIVRDDNIDKVRNLVLQGADVNARDRDGWTPIMHAPMKERARVCEFLIQNGARVNSINQKNESALLIACNNPKKSDLIQILLAAGAEVNYKTPKSKTPLFQFLYSCWRVRPQEGVAGLRLLLAAGADCNARDSSCLGMTPLMVAAFNNDLYACELLLQYGGDPELRDSTGRHACEFVGGSLESRQAICSLLNDPQKIREVIIRDDNPRSQKWRKTDANIANALMNRELGWHFEACQVSGDEDDEYNGESNET